MAPHVNALPPQARRLAAGTASGLLAGVAFAWLATVQNADVDVALLGGLPSDMPWTIVHLLLAASIGATFG